MNDLKEKTARLLGKTNNRKTVVSVLAVSVVVHLILGISATVWIVASYFQKPDVIFESQPIVAIPPQIVDPRLVVEEFEASASRPVLDEKILSIRATDLSLPDVPTVPADPNLTLDPNALSFAAADNQFGMGAGGGGGGGGFNFFGISGKGSSIIFVIDMSGSMVVEPRSRATWLRLEKELESALKQLGPRARFNLITFARNSERLSEFGLDATTSNIEKALGWLAQRSPARVVPSSMDFVPKAESGDFFNNTKHSGTAVHGALALAFSMKPDMLVILSDGQPTFPEPQRVRLKDRTLVNTEGLVLRFIQEQQELLPSPIPIHTVAYVPDGGEEFLQNAASQNNGTYKKIGLADQ